MILRQITTADLVYTEHISKKIYYPDLWEPMEAFQRRIDLYPQGNYLAVDNDDVMGYVYSHPWKSDQVVSLASLIDLPSQPDCYYIHDLAVDPEYRGIGVGMWLAQNILARSPFKVIKLVAVLNSHKFWERLGFRIIEPIRYAHNVDGFVMQRDDYAGDILE